MNNRHDRLQCVIALLLAVLLTIAGALPLFAAEGDSAVDENSVLRVQALAEEILRWKQDETGADSMQAWIDTDLTRTAGISAEWYVLALRQYGEYDFSAYEAALCDYLEQNEVYSASTRLKYCLSLAAVGSESSYIADTFDASVGQQGIMSYVYALHLLNNGIFSAVSREEIVNQLLSLQLADGGWALTGAVSDIDVTAMTLQALAEHSDDDSAVQTAVEKAVLLLSERQEGDGGYSSYGTPNAESASQVMIALSALGIDCLSDARFAKGGNTVVDAIERYCLPDGGFAHTIGGGYNETATAQALLAAVAYLRMTAGKSGLYVFGEPLYLAEGDGNEGNPPSETAPPISESPDLPASEPADDSADLSADQPTKTASYKLWGALGILALGAVACLILFFAKKRNYKNFLVVGGAVVLAICLLFMLDVQSAEDYYGNAPEKEDSIGKVTLTVRCDTVVGRSDSEYIPADGVILPITELEIEEGDTVYDSLVEAARLHSIQLEYNGSQKMPYIVGIGYLYEFDFGDLSGWSYRVNGESPSVGCGEYVLADGDFVEWLYTCELGNDLD